MIHEFTTYLVSIKGCSENTANAYRKDLRSFVTFIKQQRNDARWSTITRDDLDDYIVYQAQRGLKPATTNRHLASISSLYDYMKRQGMQVDNPARYESRRKQAQTIVNTIPVEDVKKAIEVADGSIKVILETLLYTGIRLQELLDIRRCDLDVMNNIIKIHGKGMKERIVYTTGDNMEHLKTYSQSAGLYDRIFSTWSQREVRAAVYEVLRPLSDAKQVSPHAIRHTFATTMAQAGTNAVTLQKTLGHNSLKTTQKYIDLGQQRTAEAYRNYQNAIA